MSQVPNALILIYSKYLNKNNFLTDLVKGGSIDSNVVILLSNGVEVLSWFSLLNTLTQCRFGSLSWLCLWILHYLAILIFLWPCVHTFTINEEPTDSPQSLIRSGEKICFHFYSNICNISQKAHWELVTCILHGMHNYFWQGILRA